MKPQRFWAVLTITKWESMAIGPWSLRTPGGMEGSVGFLAVFETQEQAAKAYPNHPSIEIAEVVTPKKRAKRRAKK